MVRVAVPTNGRGLEGTVAPVFARAPAFLIADVDEKGNITNTKVIQNPATTAAGGAGPMAVQMLINEGVDIIVAPQVGPSSLGAIQAAGIRLYQVSPGTPVEEAIKMAISGKATQPPAPAYGPIYPSYPAYYGPASGWGWGRGRGRGGRGWGARLGYCPRTGMPNRRTPHRLYGWW
ncbi:NifB/NifX family molybdenum-iron cluster-binding protein [Pyrococcus yayanosii]|uniref:Iron-molybdenum cofactor-binding protein n=1 Tax=Pyrococcus yayanosii (strain CH1 / JCM 16557) TaxID=529709 RepID=F8AJD2_PYRYC|nr:NifB/NifX family molybdenum-iron cluster-binding protein [Pyrococcus yayanosii]AEH24873.1 iron-molybdenum cofactor-binding protein [Pyrococcus yayanosii CH1]